MKTGKQVFEDYILANLNRSVQVKEIISSTETSVTFKVCNTKWMVAGQSFVLNNEEWGISGVNPFTKVVTATIPSEEAEINVNDVILIVNPTFLSGTPRNLEGENKLRNSAGVPLIMPLVWLFENIDGENPDKFSEVGAIFNYQFYCLTEYNYSDWLNDDRHDKCVYPMTQLKDAVLEAIDTAYELKRVGSAQFEEFSRFGREDISGFQKYILNLNLSGVECRTSVEVDRDSCTC